MEPLGALSLACNIFDLIERAYKGAKIVKEIYNAPGGQRSQHAQLENTLDDVKEIWEQLEHDNTQGSRLQNGVHFQEVARKSQEASNAMRVILDECKSKKPGNLRHAAAAFVRSFSKGRQIEEQLLILGQCRESLKLHIMTSTHYEVGELLKSLKRVDIGQQNILVNLQALLKELHDNDGQNLSLQLGKIKNISGQAVARFNANRIIQSLDVSHTRYDEVIDASLHTYRWIQEDIPAWMTLGRLNMSFPWGTSQAKMSLKLWLQSGHGIFHIAGKPGSGKSTLMKFLMKSDGTEKLLKTWADSEELVIIKFFFWKPGSPSQNTLRGLKRSVVAQILKNVPELSQDLFPNFYRVELGLDLLEKPIVDSSDVELAFERLFGSQRISKLKQYKICLFLDGLDEFNEATERVNHADLVKQIKEWVGTSGGHVKVVLSSRQLPAFESIPAVHRVKLQDINKRDITDYVNGTLDVNPNFKKLQSQDPLGCQLMIEEIVTRSDGVFLWVSLVVQSIQDGLENLDPLTKLRTRINKTPQELGELFDQILSRINQGPYHKEVYLLLAIASTELWAGQSARELAPEGKENEYPFISLLAACCLFHFMDSGLPLQSIFRYGIEGYGSERSDDSVCIISISATRISGRCLGLLEVVEHDDRRYSSKCVKFLHRSIPEHLRNHISKQLNDLHIGQVDILNTMAWMITIELECLGIIRANISFSHNCLYDEPDRLPDHLSVSWGHITGHVAHLIHWATVASIHSQVKLEDTTFQLLNSIDRAIFECSYKPTLKDEAFSSFTPILLTALNDACYFGLDQYVKWTLARRLKLNFTSWESALLLYNTYAGYSRHHDCSTIFQILFDNDISANCSISYWEYPGIIHQITIFDNMWLLIIGISISLRGPSCQPSLISVPTTPSEIWSIIQKFLTLGARPKWFVIWKPPGNEIKMKHLREMLEVDAEIYTRDRSDGLYIRDFDVCSEITGKVMWSTRGRQRLELSSSNRRLFRGLLDEYGDTSSSERSPSIPIHFEDLLKHLLPKNGAYISSLLRQRTPEEQITSENDHDKGTATIDGEMQTRDVAKLQWRPSAILVLCLVVIFGSLSVWAS